MFSMLIVGKVYLPRLLLCQLWLKVMIASYSLFNACFQYVADENTYSMFLG